MTALNKYWDESFKASGLGDKNRNGTNHRRVNSEIMASASGGDGGGDGGDGNDD